MIDLVFVVDGNAALQFNPTNWKAMTDLIANTVQQLTIGPNATNVGVVIYAQNALNPIFLNSAPTKAQLIQQIQNLRPIGGTFVNISAGLDALQTAQFQQFRGDRPNAPNVAVLLATTNSRLDPRPIATAAKKAGITIYTAGVTNTASIPELTAISSAPQQINQTVFTNAAFTTATSLVNPLKTQLCKPVITRM